MVSALPGLSGNPGWVRSSALNLRLLVDRQHHGMLGRVDVEADDVLELGREFGIGRALEGADAVRLEVMRRPDTLHRAQGDAAVSGQGAAGPVGRFAGRLGAGQRNDPAHGRLAQGRLARLTGGIAQQAIDARLGKPSLPAPHRRAPDPGPSGDLGDVPVARPSPR
jgi:hypothetical protein